MVHWPNNPPVRIERMLDIERGDVANVSTLHFVCGGEGIDRIPLDATKGRARVMEIQDPTSINPDALVPHGIGRGECILFKTRNSPLVWWTQDFIEDLVYASGRRPATSRSVGSGPSASRCIRRSSGRGSGSSRVSTSPG
jgi:arylformamidase